jgi:Carboxypeptidase regulatory-like domain
MLTMVNLMWYTAVHRGSSSPRSRMPRGTCEIPTEVVCPMTFLLHKLEARGMLLRSIVIALWFFLSCVPLHAQTVPYGAITGIVTDPSGAALVGARVMASRVSSNVSRTARTDAAGQFSFSQMTPGRYVLHIDAVGFKAAEAITEAGSRNSVPITIVLAVQGTQETVTVEGTGTDVDTAARAHADISSSLTDALPDTAVNGGFSRVLTLGTPGVAAESNGGFHPLGEHAEVSFSVDGQPISDQQSRTFSNQVSLNTVESIDVINGAPPAEFGDKTSMIVRAVTRSGLGAGSPSGTLSLGYGEFGTGTTDLSLQTGDSKVGNFLAADVVNSQRFLDPPEFVPLHATGNAETLFYRFDLQPTPADSLHLNLSLSRSWFQTPNTYDQRKSGQDQRQFMRNGNFAVAYSHVFSPSWLFDANLWWRGDLVDYYPSRNLFADQPTTLAQKRSLKNFGARADASFSKGRHNLKTGATVQWTPLTESFATGLTDPGFNSPCVNQHGVPVPDPTLRNPEQCDAAGDLPNSAFQPNLLRYDLSRGGKLYQFHGAATIKEQSAYVQDSITLGRFAINPGLRIDRYDGISHRVAAQPRVGLSYQLPVVRTVLRASYARVMVTPYNENLVLSSSTGPGGLAGGGLGNATVVPLFPGRRNQFNVGLAQAIGKKLTIDAEYFWKFTNGAFDFNVILDTPLNFPVQFAKAKIDGAMAKVSLANIHGLSAFSVMGHTRSRLFSPEVGGINFGTQYAPVARPDHDQAFQQTTFVRYQPTLRAPWVGFTWRFDSGLVAVSVPDYATALTLSGDEQAQMGLYCGSVFATVNVPLRSCASPTFGATRVHIVPVGTYDPDRNPSRITPRNLFDVAAGFDDIWHREHYHLDGKITVTNLADKVAVYNFLSSFSGTHFVTPRSVQAELRLRF